jgi:GDP-mannose pyrophosphatase NudK
MNIINKDIPPRVVVRDREILADDWGVLTKYHITFLRKDGTPQELTRETYDRGHGAVILLYNTEANSVLLTRQFRFPAFIAGRTADLIEAPAGLLDERDPVAAILKETEEEAGVTVLNVTKIGEIYMSPGSVTERLHFFVAPFTSAMRSGAGGGNIDEGEEINVIELPFPEALRMIDEGEIVDAKTIILLQHAALKGLCHA